MAAAGAGDRHCPRDAGNPMHDIERMLTQVGHLPAGIVPEPAEMVDRAVQVVRPLRRRTEPHVVIQLGRRRSVGRIAETRRDVPKVARLDRYQFPNPAGANQLAGPLIMGPGTLLRADLDHSLVSPRRRNHPAPFAHEQRQRLFHIHVFSRRAGQHRHQCMPVVGRRDDHGIDIFVLEQLSEVAVPSDGTANQVRRPFHSRPIRFGDLRFL